MDRVTMIFSFIPPYRESEQNLLVEFCLGSFLIGTPVGNKTVYKDYPETEGRESL